MTGLLLLLLFLGVAAYCRANGWILTAAAVLGALLGGAWWLAVAALAVGVVFCLADVRRKLVTDRVFRILKR